MKLPIYLDYSATTPVDPRVAQKMMQCLTLDGTFGNPASRSHRFGWQAEEAVDVARNQIAELINADPREIVFTSGATESDNLAIKGAAHAQRAKGHHIITSQTEHKAVLDTCAQLETEGFEVTYLTPQADGVIPPQPLKPRCARIRFWCPSCRSTMKPALSRISQQSASFAAAGVFFFMWMQPKAWGKSRLISANCRLI